MRDGLKQFRVLVTYHFQPPYDTSCQLQKRNILQFNSFVCFQLSAEPHAQTIILIIVGGWYRWGIWFMYFVRSWCPWRLRPRTTRLYQHFLQLLDTVLDIGDTSCDIEDLDVEVLKRLTDVCQYLTNRTLISILGWNNNVDFFRNKLTF